MIVYTFQLKIKNVFLFLKENLQKLTSNNFFQVFKNIVFLNQTPFLEFQDLVSLQTQKIITASQTSFE